ncbi:MAG: hypothetical protein GXO76_11380 [Calditrichaeota bacterium]|nr:hypothetical protein [Calditrichota bacterium]
MKTFVTGILVGLVVLASGFFANRLLAQTSAKTHFTLQNEKVKLGVLIQNKQLAKDCLRVLPDWAASFHTQPVVLHTDADFALNVMWTGWHAPGKINNAENPVVFTKKDFRFERAEKDTLSNREQRLVLYFKGTNNPFLLKLTYSLKPNAFFARRTLAVRDTVFGLHFLRKVASRKGRILAPVTIVKSGSFGQPAAFTLGQGGGFFGLEYPTSENHLAPADKKSADLICKEIIGKRIQKDWLETDPVVEAVTPNAFVKHWFFTYLEDIRVTTPQPYILYNSWYDLRSPLMVKDSSHVMNAENIRKIIHLFKTNMVDKYGIRLNAFVLDDGWDIYRSDWVLRKKQFPNGLKPISDELEKMGTHLGIWFGPIGGYSYRSWRVGWMKQHGYETVDGEMCLAGKHYSQLFKKRVVDFVEKDGVRFYKWDGIQFSCSQPDHGHKIGIYSRKAVMDTVVTLCRAVRAHHPDVYLNITSGTWLSPWWLRWANQIWMQSSDYGYSDVPSISRRDAAMTYRDLSLYKDFTKEDLWFPISNMMTHGIIKGNLQKLGGQEEPLDKFTNNALLYFARGVSMWELYISPDLLTDGEWQALAQSIRWAKDRFFILKHTEMVGGDPGKKEPYAYVHFSGYWGIVAARNPGIEPKKLVLRLAPEMGLNPEAASLVVERVYPDHWVSPDLVAAGVTLELPLQGFETAVYEIYPLGAAQEPLLGGATYDFRKTGARTFDLSIFKTGDALRWLNPEQFASPFPPAQSLKQANVSAKSEVFVSDFRLQPKKRRAKIEGRLHFKSPVTGGKLAVLLVSDASAAGKWLPRATAKMDGKTVQAKKQTQKGRWKWLLYPVTPGETAFRITLAVDKKHPGWQGTVSVWFVGTEQPGARKISIQTREVMPDLRPMPPHPRPEGQFDVTVKLGEETIRLK